MQENGKNFWHTANTGYKNVGWASMFVISVCVPVGNMTLLFLQVKGTVDFSTCLYLNGPCDSP